MSKKTVKSLVMLSKLKRLELVEKQQALAQMQVKLQALNQQVKDIAKARELELECTRTDSHARLTLQIYLEGLRTREKTLKQQIYHLADFMIPVQESVREAFKQVKSLEISTERLQNQMTYEQDKAEQAFLDEISMQKKARDND
jgi:flagellar export protein FliJ